MQERDNSIFSLLATKREGPTHAAVTAAAVMVRTVTVGRLRAVGARIAGTTATRFTLSDPATEWIPTAIISVNLIDC